MNNRQLLQQVLIATSVAVLMVSCGGPTATSQPTPASIPATAIPTSVPPTSAPTPEPPTEVAKPVIKTSVGDLVISDVQLSDRFPPDCANPPSAMCQPAKEGFQVLAVWLEKKDGSDPGSVGGKLFDASKGVYVKAEDASQTDSFSGGMANGKLFVAFTPPASARNFTLFWPDNTPIALGK